MSVVVLDTDVVSLIFKRHPLSEPYLDAFDGSQLVLSFMSLAELKLWSKRRSWGEARVAKLYRFLNNFTVCHTGVNRSEGASGSRRGKS